MTIRHPTTTAPRPPGGGHIEQPPFLPMCTEELRRLGWDGLDVLLVTGDAYVDHPSFGAPLVGRWLVSHGFRVGIVAQPRWDSPQDVLRLGRPRLFAGVTAGALDSMLAHYTAFRKKRSDDPFTPGGRSGARPNRATIVYAGLVRQAFPGLVTVGGGIEASLRRAVHYDFWTDALRKPIVLDAKLDLVLYGMAERAVLELACRLAAQAPERLSDRHGLAGLLAGIRGTVRAARGGAIDGLLGAGAIELPSYEAMKKDPREFMRATVALEQQVHAGSQVAVQRVGDRAIVLEPPSGSLSTKELDSLYALPFTRKAHPSYRQAIPAEKMIASSVTSHRGCGGGCAFCSLALHQGRHVQSRSAGSILAEVERLAGTPGFAGAITDIGGPSANMWGARCDAPAERCRRSSCLVPSRCRHFRVDQSSQVELLRKVKQIKDVRHVRVSSGVRMDLALSEPAYVRALAAEFTGGQLKVAPEHVAAGVLKLMRKPPPDVFLQFIDLFAEESRRAGKEQYLVPYLVSAFPGTADSDMRLLARFLDERGWRPQGVQCFVPTPGTVATAMYYGEIDTDGCRIHVARTDAERLRQHGILTGTAQDGRGGGLGTRTSALRDGRPSAPKRRRT